MAGDHPIAGVSARAICLVMAGAYSKRQDEDGLWEVYDEDSGEVITLDGLPLSGLDEEEADDAVRALTLGEISPDRSPESP